MNDENLTLDNCFKVWLAINLEDTIRNLIKEELNTFFEERFKNEKGSIQSVHDNIDNLRDVHINELKNALYRLQDNFGDLQANVDGLRGEISDIKRPNGILDTLSNKLFQKSDADLKRFQSEIDKANREIADLRRRMDNLNKSLQDEKAKVIEANQNYSNALTRLNVKDGELSRTQRELTDVKDTLAAKERELVVKESELTKTRQDLTVTKNDLSAERDNVRWLNEQLANTENDLDKTQNQLNDVNEELSTTKGQLSQAQESASKANEKVKEWTSSADIYLPLRTAITKCAIFRPIVKKYSLDDMSDTGLLAYIKAIGMTETFATEIYLTAVENKKQTRAYMTFEEAEVYDALNKVYRENWKIDYDIFALPGGQAVTENFRRTSFDSTTSLYIQNPRDKNLPYTTGVYVPILMRKDGGVSQKAYVDASNR